MRADQLTMNSSFRPKRRWGGLWSGQGDRLCDNHRCWGAQVGGLTYSLVKKAKDF